MSDVYVVTSSDYQGLSGIAKKYNTTVAELLKLNRYILPPDYIIRPGDKITLPIKKEPINIRKKKVKVIKENTLDVEPEDDGTECPKVKITLLKPCSNKVNLGCKKIGLEGVEFSSNKSELGKTDKNGEIVLKKKDVEKLTFNITFKKHPYYKDTSIQTPKDQEVILEYDRKKVIKEILSSTGLISRSSWSTQVVDEKKLTEHWCYHIIAIHHTGDGFINSPEEIEEEHKGKYDDIGYHYIVAKDGTIYEGRKIGYLGSHIGGNNSYKIGINLIGDYNDGEWFRAGDDGEVPTAQIAGAIKLINSLKEIFPLKELGGHQDYATKAGATCPGNLLYKRLDEMRTAIGLSKPEFIQKVHKTYYEGKNKC